MPDLSGHIDPCFDHPFVPEEHEELMQKQVDLSHLNVTRGKNQDTKRIISSMS